MKKCILSLAVVLAASCSAFASGFGLYEHSAVSHAMGDTLVGKAMDASANFHNPATLTDLPDMQVTIGFVTEHPRGRVETREAGDHYHEHQMDPGVFWIPHFQFAAPLPWDFTFGLGFGAEYGLGTKYSNHWAMDWSAVETTIEGLVFTPNLAYKITDDWSVGAGLRWLYFDFEQFSNPQVTNGGYELARYRNHLHGDNGFSDIGWQIGTKYDITKTLSVGLVYKSAIDIKVKGYTHNRVDSWRSGAPALARDSTYQAMMAQGYTPEQISMMPQSVMERYISTADSTIRGTVASEASRRTGRASAKLTLPQSVAGGVNWDVFPTWHLGAMVSWTEWSKFDTLHFDLEGGDRDFDLSWRDTWRFSVGSRWDFAEDWSWMASYTYDMDSTSGHQQSVMLPPANRHILATGFTWNCWGGLELALSYACIFMDGRDMQMQDAFGTDYDLRTKWGFCHAAGFSVTYRF